ncbi:glycoside hydrolase family 2 protein [Xylanibacter brevis]|uniref:glycoside hydrolase family 2 protein n=1 Tax=Xylanibacter brevis TaxID=83231 RepID=UPI0005C71830
MRKKDLLAFVCAIGMTLPAVAQVRMMSLNSADKQVVWTVTPQDEVSAKGQDVSQAGFTFRDGVVATVPGVVFADYVNAGREENPDIADNIYRVDETKYSKPYWYRTEFNALSLQEGQRVWLCFDNTNRYADFYFNGHKISGTEESTKDVSGHMLRSRFDVTPYYNNRGKNAVAVLIYDADQKKTRKAEGPYGVACSPSYLAGAGWDWMPYVPGRLAGITGNARIEITGDVVMDDPWVRSFLPSWDEAEITVSSELRNVSSEKKTVVMEGVIQPGNIRFQKRIEMGGGETRTLHIDRNDVEALLVKKPKLWWPNGYGEPNLYTCHLTTVVDGKQTDQRTIRFGIKKYEYRIEKNAVNMPVLTFYVNGQRVFVKGGNWGMSEYLLRMHGQQYETPIRLHKEMNYNMIRLWTGCVTDDEFYDYCDEYGIMVWNDFWLYVAWNDVAEHDAFKTNARDKVRRLRNHPSIALWCGANETHPVADIDQALRMIVMEEDANDRLYTSCSNQDAKSGSGWWKDMPPRHHFETSASNLAFNTPSYPYGNNYGYGCRSEIGMATFPTFESVREFIPKKEWWPLPTDEQLEKDDETVWNKHFFGKEAWNGGPIDYKKSVNERYGESKSLEEFCEKAQLINLEDMKGMYEAWNDKMWNDASALLIWMSHPAYPSFVWQTYDYYYDPTGCYWGAKQACEPLHVQWNCLTNSVKVINASSQPLRDVVVTARIYDINGREVTALTTTRSVPLVEASNIKEAFVLDFADEGLSPLHFIQLEMTSQGQVLSRNFYWRNGEKELDYRALLTLPEAKLKVVADQPVVTERSGYAAFNITLTNTGKSVAFANRLRVVNSKTGERVLPAIMSDGYVTLMPGEQRTLRVEVPNEKMTDGLNILLKQFNQKERVCAKVKYKNKQ